MRKFVLLFTLFFLTCSNFLDAQSIQRKNELLWEISGNGLKTKSYLYGSLHSNDKRLFRLSDSVYVALNATKSVVLETDIFSLFDEWDTRKDEIRLLYDNQGKPYTANDKATETLYGNEDGMPQFLDAYFLQYCYNAKKKFYPLETVEEQLGLLTEVGLPDANGVDLPVLDYLQEKVIELYLQGDIEGLNKMMKVNLSVEGDTQMYDELIVRRNERMTKGLDSLMRLNPLFCAVGAGHLAGDQGIITLLRKKGYKVRKVTAVFSEGSFAAKDEVRSFKSYNYYNDKVGLVAVFPGLPKELKIYDGHPYIIYRELGQGNTFSIEIVPVDGTLTLAEQAAIYIASPDASPYTNTIQDDGTEYYEGISDTYPEGPHWIRVLQNDEYLLILRAYGGNKFMNSNRPKLFFSRVWFDQ
ncbi:MAG: hypothetical protein RL632_18 [Bacteroidota bacterium]|jgi:uncharacterized protein YbaP (TraB family)